MSKFTNKTTGMVVTVADDKDGRYSPEVWDAEPLDEAPPAPTPKKSGRTVIVSGDK